MVWVVVSTVSALIAERGGGGMDSEEPEALIFCVADGSSGIVGWIETLPDVWEIMCGLFPSMDGPNPGFLPRELPSLVESPGGGGSALNRVTDDF